MNVCEEHIEETMEYLENRLEFHRNVILPRIQQIRRELEEGRKE